MLPLSWKPVPVAGLVRLGSTNDGGYIVSAAAVDAADLLIGMGLNDDWNFEADFMARNGGKVVCFDHSVTASFWKWHIFNNLRALKFKQASKYLAYRRFFATDQAQHRKLKIGYDDKGSVSLAKILVDTLDRAIFLKIDIEGSEYRILDDIVANSDRFTGLVIEFHDIDLHRKRITDFLDALGGFDIVDLHGNNFGGADPAGDPLVIEISLTRRDLDNLKEGLSTAPNALAVPCDPSRPEIALAFEAVAA